MKECSKHTVNKWVEEHVPAHLKRIPGMEVFDDAGQHDIETLVAEAFVGGYKLRETEVLEEDAQKWRLLCAQVKTKPVGTVSIWKRIKLYFNN